MSSINNNNNNNNSSKSNSYIYKSLLLCSIGAAVYLGYQWKNKLKKEEKFDEDDDEKYFNIETETAGYSITPLNASILNNTQPLTTDHSNTNQNTRKEYIQQLLKQRRFSSVLCNQYLHHSKIEHYFHFNLNSSSQELMQLQDIKWVLIVKSAFDVKLVCKRLLQEFPQFCDANINANNLPQPIGNMDRFYMVVIRQVLIVSCGNGGSSLSILLQELTKMLVDFGAFSSENHQSLHFNTSYVEYILLTTAPGIKTSPSAFLKKRRLSLDNLLVNRSSSSSLISSPATISSSMPASKIRYGLASLRVDIKSQRELFRKKRESNADGRPSQITNGEIPVILPSVCYDENLLTYRRIVSCGEYKSRVMKFDRHLISDIKIRCGFLRSLKPKMGKGLCVQYFHEALSYKSMVVSQPMNVRSKFIQSCIDCGIKYVDMESGFLAQYCHKMNISSVAVVGIEFDIASPNVENENMRVSHERAIQATLDVFCQYLWDRLNSQQMEMQGMHERQKSSESVISSESSGDGSVQHVQSLKRAQSRPMLSTSQFVSVGDGRLASAAVIPSLRMDDDTTAVLRDFDEGTPKAFAINIDDVDGNVSEMEGFANGQ